MTTRDPQKSACVLVSGGVESAVLLNDALGRYEQVTPVYIKNGLRWEETEIFHLKNYVRSIRNPRLLPLKILESTMRDLYEGHWSLTGTKVPGANSRDSSVYLAGRNVVFLTKAGVFAAQNHIGVIEIGVLRGNPFPDSTKVFLKKMADVLEMALSHPIQILAPLAKFKKDDVIAMGKKLPLEFTFSCINPKGFEHCGECNKCMERKKAFFAAGIFDKTKYKKSGI